jgi:class 3 adenylate cyclase/tetratricopeptide (TPR) repeat protein
MAACVVCGVENRAGARFCDACGGELMSAPFPRHRKTVTVVFCDLVGSTPLGESVDPEAVEALLARYFDRMNAIVVRHGGTVEKFVGDAVVAVFGIPIAHEDDALRALRAASEMRDAVVDLGLDVRVGVDTGEVIANQLGTIVTGDAANVAARLQQVAAPGEILVGRDTLVFVRDAVVVGDLVALDLKGKAEPVQASRLLAVGEAPEPAHLSGFVGRAGELELLKAAWMRSAADGRCEVVTIVGEPGVGKSRLIGEFVARLGTAAVQGRCPPYGEGITYFAVVEVIKQLGPLPPGVEGAAPLRSLLGETDLQTTANEIAWGFRRLLEENSPLVVVFDDIQWGEETFLDLIEHVRATSMRSSLVVCLARPELSRKRPGWAVSLSLGPLPDADVAELVPSSLATSLRNRIIQIAGGNPLYAIEMTAMAAAATDAESLVVPHTLKALLIARLDQLPPSERSVLEVAAVEGELFHRGAVEALFPERASVQANLGGLIAKDLIGRTRSSLPSDEGFKFHHLLLRDAAYDALPKATRVGLHEQFASWIDSKQTSLVEREEIVGYHLEQAVRFGRELGYADDRIDPMAERASSSLASAGRRAAERGDVAAARELLHRATGLIHETNPQLPGLLLTLSSALRELGVFVEAREKLDELEPLAEATHDRRLQAHIVIDRNLLRIFTEPGVDPDEIRRVCEVAAGVMAEYGDDQGLAKALHLSGAMSIASCRFGEATEKFESALEHARRARDRTLKRTIASQLTVAAILGPGTVEKERRKLEAVAASEADDRLLVGRLTTAIGYLHALAGDLDEGRALAGRGLDIAEDLGAYVVVALLRIWTGGIELLAGDAAAAEAEFLAGLVTFERLGETGVSPTLRALLAVALVDQGRSAAAAQQVSLTEQATNEGDRVTGLLLAILRARLAAGANAERLARAAVGLTAATDALLMQGDALVTLARATSSASTAEQAYAIFKVKGSVSGMRTAGELAVRYRSGVLQ